LPRLRAPRGPAPSSPRAEGGYIAVERTAPWPTREGAFEGGCLVAGEMRACPD